MSKNTANINSYWLPVAQSSIRTTTIDFQALFMRDQGNGGGKRRWGS